MQKYLCRNLTKTHMLCMRLTEWSLFYGPTQLDLCFPPWQWCGLAWASQPHGSGTTAWQDPFGCSIDVTGRIYWNKGAEELARFLSSVELAASYFHPPAAATVKTCRLSYDPAQISQATCVQYNQSRIKYARDYGCRGKTLPVLLTLIRQLERNCGCCLLSPGNFTGLTPTKSQENSGGQKQQ